jgi:hypothetical protein
MQLYEQFCNKVDMLYINSTPPTVPAIPCTVSLTQRVKQVVNLFARNGVSICPGKISGGAFNPQGSLLYLACEGKNKIIVLDAAATRQHRVLANFTTEAQPTDIAVDK